MKLRLISALCVVVLLAADKKEEPKDELEATWVPVSSIRDGVKDENPPPGLKLVFKNGTVSVFVNDKTEETMEYKLDPSQKPKTIDLTKTSGAAKGTGAKGIYEIDGDTLRLCVPTMPEKVNNRPTKFASEKDSGYTLLTLKREKK
jgi:uncharacterized protein (TIGR03067 family)